MRYRLMSLLLLVALAVPGLYGAGLCSDNSAVNLATVGSDFSCTVGTYTFSNFYVSYSGLTSLSLYLGSGSMWDGNEATLVFQTPTLNRRAELDRDVILRFMVSGAAVYATGLSFGTGYGTGEGYAGISELVCSAPGSTCSAQNLLANMYADRDNPYAFTTLSTPGSPIWVMKDIAVDSGVMLSDFTQTFSGAVPEPVSMIFVGSGLLVVGLLRYRRK